MVRVIEAAEGVTRALLKGAGLLTVGFRFGFLLWTLPFGAAWLSDGCGTGTGLDVLQLLLWVPEGKKLRTTHVVI
jgi:hypothetical protein